MTVLIGLRRLVPIRECRRSACTGLDCVFENHEVLIITRNGQQFVVMLLLAEFTALEAAANLLHSPNNAMRLIGAIEQLSAGAGTELVLAE